ncbi:MAG: response regulator [Desulfosarcina sp.]|nr:response regulator [Desulfobacterales bacterium]
MKILIVDDNTVILSVIEAILRQENHDIFMGSNGVLGYNQFLNIWPDLVVTDIEMPWQDGISMVQSIRRQAPSVRTLYMTGNPGPFLLSLKMEQQRYPVGVLDKPFTRSDLLRAINDVMLLDVSPAAQEPPARTVMSRKRHFRESLCRARFEVEGLNERSESPYTDSCHISDIFVDGRGRAGAAR